MLNGKPNTIGSTRFAKIQKNVWKNTIAAKMKTKMKLIIVDLLRLTGLAAELLDSFPIVNDLFQDIDLISSLIREISKRRKSV